jgi:hypothetical protein
MLRKIILLVTSACLTAQNGGQQMMMLAAKIAGGGGGGVAATARQFNGTNQYLQSASAVNLSGTQVLTISFFLYWDTFSNNDDFGIELTGNCGSNVGGFAINPNEASGVFEFAVCGNVPGVNYLACTIARPSAAAWHHYMLQWSATGVNTCQAYVDGSSVTTTKALDNIAATNFANSTLNVFSRNAASLFGAGRISELAIWGSTLSSGNATSLAAYTAASSIDPGNLLYYWPINGTSPEPATVGSVALTVTGATVVAGPNP